MNKRLIPLLVLASSMLFSCGTINVSKDETEINEESISAPVSAAVEDEEASADEMLEPDEEIASYTISSSKTNKNIRRANEGSIKIKSATLNVLSNIDLVFIVDNTFTSTSEYASTGVLCWKTLKENIDDYVYGSDDALTTFSYDEAYDGTGHTDYYCLI